MGKERIVKSTTRQHVWFPWKHLHQDMIVVRPVKYALQDEELKEHLGSKISHVIVQALQTRDDDFEEGDNDSLTIQINNCSLNEVEDQDTNLLDCCELVLPDEDLAEYSNAAVVPELSSKEALELAATKKRYFRHHHNNHRALEIDPFSDSKCAAFYSRVGVIMQSVPALEDVENKVFLKGFQIIPLLSNWEEVLLLTQPDLWCPEAVYHATLAFLSFHKLHQLKSFLEHILLKRSLGHIRTRGFLDQHLYLALRHVSHADPTLFCKAVVMPMNDINQWGGCSLQEASVLGGILSNAYIPGPTGSNVLLALTQLSAHYSITHSVFIIVFLEKKPVLPFRVLTSLVDHFCSMKDRASKMPLMWYQSMYLFLDLYGTECVSEQKERLLETSQIVFHHHWSALIGDLIWKLLKLVD